MFSRFRSTQNILKDISKIQTGDIDIAIGTHRLLSKDVKFQNLGLLIVDEEHRFGVRQKDNIRKLKANVDTLYMSATPIPRTLSMALSKLKEMSLIQTSPKERLPIRTIVTDFNLEVIKNAINREVARGGQVFFLHNRVQTIESMRATLIKLLPEVRFQVGHGQLPKKKLEIIMNDFAQHKFDVLIASTIIENGIDIQNANTMLINDAHMFGLAQLYQLRGRVGRSHRRAYAYLIVNDDLTDIARTRISTLTEYDSLGAGYQIATRDLEIRGTGSLLGTKQSGVIQSVGFSYYNRLLNQAVTNLENKNPNGLWDDEKKNRKEQLQVESDFYFPKVYIGNEKERLKIYNRLLSIDELNGFEEMFLELEDRFGKLPEPAKSAILYYKLRFLTKITKLLSCKTQRKQVILEFENKNLPKRDLIGKLVSMTNYPVSFETTAGFKIKFDFSKEKNSKKSLLQHGVEILESFLNLKK